MLEKIIDDYKKSIGGSSVYLTGKGTLKISEIVRISRNKAKLVFKIPQEQRDKFKQLRRIIFKQVKTGIPIYGTTTSYGARASLVLNKGDKEKRLENAIRLSNGIVHVDVSTGDPIPQDVVRAAILIRVNMLLSGHSGIRFKNLNSFKDLLNNNITPVVGRYGTLSASGDLALNGRVLSCLLHNEHARVFDRTGNVVAAKATLESEGIGPINLLPKEGLACVNGDNFSTAASALLVQDVLSLMLINTLVAALNIEVLRGSTRNFHPLLSHLRQHPGQEFESFLLRTTLNGSKLAYQEMKGPISRESGVNVQDPYSIRCLPQYYGPDWEAIKSMWETIVVNANSVSDNPLWTTPETTVEGEAPYQWVSGGNFLAMHMVESIDRLRKIMTHIVKQNDRHVARLVHPELNNGLPANLSDKDSVTQSVFKGVQTQLGMYEIYAGMLAQPVSTEFGTHEEFNQDITSHAFTSAIIAWELLKITKLAVASDLICACQAVDLRGGPSLLSPQTLLLYRWVRRQVPYIKKEQPIGHYIELIADKLFSEKLILIAMNSMKI